MLVGAHVGARKIQPTSCRSHQSHFNQIKKESGFIEYIVNKSIYNWACLMSNDWLRPIRLRVAGLLGCSSVLKQRKCSEKSAAGNVLRNLQQEMFLGICSRKCSQEFAAENVLRNQQQKNFLGIYKQEMFLGICSRKCS